MKKSLIILFSLMVLCISIPLRAQSVFDDYGTAVTCLSVSPYASLSLSAMDHNPAGNAFLRKGFEFSVNNLWPRFQLVGNYNANTFLVKNEEVSRKCYDPNNWWVPNPSARLSYRFGDHAVSFSYVHGESVWQSDGNSCFDEMIQDVIPASMDMSLELISLQLRLFNLEANRLSDQMLQQFGVDESAPYGLGTSFTTTVLSKSSQYGCRSDKFSVGYTYKINIGNDDKWKYLSLYAGMKYQRLFLHQKSYIGPYCVNVEGSNVISVMDLCSEYTKFYKTLSSKIPEMSDYYNSMAKRFEDYGLSCDTLLIPFPCSSKNNSWGMNAALGFDLVYPHCNFASTIEFGYLPFKFSMGYSQYLGRWQISIGGELGYADSNYGSYSRLFNKQLGYDVDNYLSGDIGAEVSYRFPGLSLILKAGSAFGFNKDVLLGNGYIVLLNKQKITCSPSIGFEWQASNLFTLVGGIRFNGISLSGKEFELKGVIDNNAKYIVNPECHFSVGFIAHLE